MSFVNHYGHDIMFWSVLQITITFEIYKVDYCFYLCSKSAFRCYKKKDMILEALFFSCLVMLAVESSSLSVAAGELEIRGEIL